MYVRVSHIIDAFELFYDSLWRREFRRSLRLQDASERYLLPLVRTFLLGYFGESIVPEAAASLPGGLSGFGRLDFLVETVAVEFVVRRPDRSSAVLMPNQNVTEAKKLLSHDGPAVLILFDLSNSPIGRAALNDYRELPSLGKGKRSSPFSVAYFAHAIGEDGPETQKIRLNIRCG